MQNVIFSVRGLWAWSFTFLFVYLKLTDQTNLNWLLVVSPALIRLAYVQGSIAYAMYLAHKHPEDIPQEEHTKGTGFYA